MRTREPRRIPIAAELAYAQDPRMSNFRLHPMPPGPRTSLHGLRVVAAALMTCAAGAQAAQPARNASTDLSAASMLPVAVSVALPVALVAGSASLVVAGVESSADGVSWIVENGVTGAKASLRF